VLTALCSPLAVIKGTYFKGNGCRKGRGRQGGEERGTERMGEKGREVERGPPPKFRGGYKIESKF